MANYVGIDFGTTNSAVAAFNGSPQILRRNEQDVLPSVVAVRNDGSVVIGHEAKAISRSDNGYRSIKTILGENEYVTLKGTAHRPEEIAASIFRKLKEIAEENLHEPVTRAVITVPANSKGMQRSATKIAAGLARIQVLTLINEPTAAAMAYGLDSRKEQTVMVYDFGGGTFDVTILRVHHGVFEELSSKGIRHLGGDNIDRRLVEYAANECYRTLSREIVPDSHEFKELELECEKAKIRLSNALSASVRLISLGFECDITREHFNGMIESLIAETRSPMDTVLSDAQLTKDDIDTVLLVGGTSKIPAVREFVMSYFGREILSDGVDPMTCVAEGAAIASALLQDAPGMDDYAYSVKLEHSLCTDPFDLERGQKVLEPIIERGRDIPCSDTHVYYPVVDYSEEITIGVYEGDVFDNPKDPANVRLASIRVPIDPPRPSEQVPIAVTYSYDAEGILTVVAVDRGTQRTFDKIVQYSGPELSPKELVQISKKTDERVASEKEYPEAVFALKQAKEKVLPALDGEEAYLLNELCERLIDAMESANDTAVCEALELLNDELIRYPFLL